MRRAARVLTKAGLRGALLALCLHATTVAADEAPRVMSLNVCTDQYVLLLADPGQIVSLSYLSDDPSLSYLHEKAEPYPKNRGSAEEVFLARPDLVVTSTFSHETTALIERVDIPVAEFAVDQTLEAVPATLRRMGQLLGQEEGAEALAAAFEEDMADVRAHQCARRPTAIAYEQNGVVLGEGTLAHSVIEAAGFQNLAAERGYVAMTPMPLEALITASPDLVILSEPVADAPALAGQINDHPALGALNDTIVDAVVPPGAWACAGPFVMDAVRALMKRRDEIAACTRPQ